MSSVSLVKPEVLRKPEIAARKERPIGRRHFSDRAFKVACVAISAASLLILFTLLGAIFFSGFSSLTWTFLTSPPDPNPSQAGFLPAIGGSVWLLVLVVVLSLPLGVSTAILMEEFPPRNWLLKRAHNIVQLNITNLAGVPSVVYGIIGLTAFASMFEMFGNPKDPAMELGVKYFDQFYNESDKVLLVPVESVSASSVVPAIGMTAYTADGEPVEINVIGTDAPWPEDAALGARTLRVDSYPGRIDEPSWYYFRIPFGRGVLAGALTLMLVILPIIIIASQEALRAVPSSLRDAAFGLGATRWQVVQTVTLPAAIPGIMTGAIIAISRAIGEAAPLLMIAGIVFITNPPGNLMDDFTAMPLQIYNWAQRPQQEFHAIAAAGIIVLLAVLLCFNGIAVYLRQKFQKPLS